MLARVSTRRRQARVLLRMTLGVQLGTTMTGKDRGSNPTRAERRNVATRAGGVWTQAERERYIAELREARRDAHAVTIQGGDVVPQPGSATRP
jgi:hypothetical protein